MDERFLSSSNQASKLLHEEGRGSICRQERCMDNFWLLNPHSAKRKIDFGDDRGSCLGTLRRSRELRWGIRKKVLYVSRQPDSPSAEVGKKEGSKKRLREKKMSDKKVGEDVKKGMSEREAGQTLNLRVRLEKKFNGVERKRENTCTNGMEPKEEDRKEPKELEKKCRTENRGSCRWPPVRFEYAKKELVEVMEKMGATRVNPVLRHDLRLEARKCIGDLGLLDHLLKHMVGMVVADGKKRFVRQHNSEGAIEYWLEPADVVLIRCRAGNADSTCTCHCHWEKMASQLKEVVDLLRSEIEDLKLTIEQSHVQLQLQPVDQAWKEKHESVLIQHQKLQEQFTAISSSFMAMKEEISSLKAEKEKRKPNEVVEEPNQANLASTLQLLQEREKGKEVVAESEVVRKNVIRIRICKPQHTILQPNIATSGSSPNSPSPATSAPPQLMLPLHPGSPPPQQFSSTFSLAQNSQRLGQTQTQLEPVLAQSQHPSPASQPTARYPSPGMKNFGASQMECCNEFMVAMAHPTETNSQESFDVATNLVLPSVTY